MTRTNRLLALAIAGIVLSVHGLAFAQQAGKPVTQVKQFVRSSLSSLPGYWELGREDVQKELELVPEQVEKLKKLGEQYTQELRDAYKGREDWRNLSQEERTAKYKKIYEDRRKRATEIREEVQKILLPHQLQALREMAFKRMGPSLLSSPRVAEAIQLTDDQKAKIKEIRAELMQDYRKLQQESSEKIIDLLTPQQKEKLKERAQNRQY